MSMKMVTKIGFMAVLVGVMLVFAVGCKKENKGTAAENAIASADSNVSSAIIEANAIKDPNAVAAGTAALPEQTICPVMGEKINKDIFTEYKGRKIYFCCPTCVEMFKKDPEKYIEKVK